VYLNEIKFSMGASTYSSGIAIGGQIPITAKAETQTTGTVTVGAGALILKEGGSTAANLTCQAKKIEATDTTLTCTTDTALPATDGKAYTLALGENLDSKITKSEPGDSLTYAVGTNVAFAYSAPGVVGGDNTITFNLVSPTYSAEIATTGTIKIKATSTTNTTGTVAVAGGLTLTKTGGTAITLTCTGVQIKTTGSELSCNPSSKIEAVAGNVYTLGIITNDAIKFTHAGDANLVFALGTSKTLTYSTENPNSSSQNPNSGSSSAFSLKFNMISLLLFFLF
jgi:hypothetical protein